MPNTEHIAKNSLLDPTLPKVELVLGGVTYHPVFTFAALAVAEAELKKVGQVVNIFHAIDFNNMDATNMVALLYASLITHHPEVKLESIPSLVTMKQIPDIRQALFDAFVLSMADPSEVKPDPLAQGE
jgi:hypothetical protein